MAIGRISGSMLLSNLDRQGANLSVDTDLVFYDVENRRLGINTVTPDHSLTVNGNTSIQGNVQITDNLSVTNTSHLSGVFGGEAEFEAINNTVIGNSIPRSGTFTNLISTGAFVSANVAITGGTLDGVAITSSDGEFIEISTSLLETSNAQITGGEILNLGNITAQSGNIRELNSGNLVIDSTAQISSLLANTAVIVDFETANASITGGNIAVSTVIVDTLTASDANIANLVAQTYALDTGTAANLTVSNLVILGNAVGTIETSLVSEKTAVTQVIDAVDYYVSIVPVLDGNVELHTNSGLRYFPATATLKVIDLEGNARIDTMFSTGQFTANSGVTATSVINGGVFLSDGTGLSLDTGNIHVGGHVVISGNVEAGVANFSGMANFSNGVTANQIDSTNIDAGNIDVSGTITVGNVAATTMTVVDLEVFESLLVNTNQAESVNVVVSGANDAALLWARSDVDPGYDSVIIGATTTSSGYFDGAKLVVDSVDSLLLPRGTTIQRPSALGYTDVAGMIRYNSDTWDIEWFDGFEWKSSSSGGSGGGGSFELYTVERDNFIGDNIETDFTLSGIGQTDSVIIFESGYLQQPNVAYTVTDTVLSFSEAPATSSDISAIRTTTYLSRDVITTTGINDTFVLSVSGTTESVLVALNGILQNPLSYDVSGYELTLSEIPPSGYVLDVVSLKSVIERPSFVTDGLSDTFILPIEASTEDTIVSLNGIVQTPSSGYTITGNVLTLSEVPAAGIDVDVIILRQEIKLSKISSKNGFNVVETTDTGIYIRTGTASSEPVQHWTTDGAVVHTLAVSTVATANTATAVDSFTMADYRSAKYLIQANDSTNHQVSEVLVIHDDTTAYCSVYGIVQTGNVGIVTADVSGASVEVKFTSVESGANVRITKDYIAS